MITKPLSSDKNENIQVGRGIAILSVAIFHFTYQWNQQFFYSEIVSNSLLKVFALGVQFFFMISGYVILKSVQTTQNLKVFFLKRAKRLFPTLTLVVPLLFLLQRSITIQNFPKIQLSDVPFSLFVINPAYTSFFLGIKSNFVTGVMWTLSYELTFYILIGLIYFLLSAKYVFEIFFLITNLTLAIKYLSLLVLNKSEGIVEANLVENSISFLAHTGIFNLSWFAIGMWFYKYEKTKPNLLQILMLIQLITISAYDAIGGSKFLSHSGLSLFAFLYFCLFLIFFARNFYSEVIFKSKIRKSLIRVGNVSYEYYLIHEVIGVTILTMISKQVFFYDKPYFAFVLIPILLFFIFNLSTVIQILTARIWRLR